MRYGLVLLALAGMLSMSSEVQARGCLRGAAVGGVAGHFAHHPILGAIAGCVTGRAVANRQRNTVVVPAH